MSSAGHVHEGEIFCWPGRSLQAFHQGLRQNSGPPV